MLRMKDLFDEEKETEKLVVQFLEKNKDLKLTRHHVENIFSELNTQISTIMAICRNDLSYAVKLFERILVDETPASFEANIYQPLRKKGELGKVKNDAQFIPLSEALLLVKKLTIRDGRFIRKTWKWQMDALECSKKEFLRLMTETVRTNLKDNVEQLNKHLESTKITRPR